MITRGLWMTYILIIAEINCYNIIITIVSLTCYTAFVASNILHMLFLTKSILICKPLPFQVHPK